MTRILLILGGAAFAAGVFARMTDPMVPLIAADLKMDAKTVALLGTAFALPWALVQPIVGPLGDLVGKTRVITVCLAILVVSAIVGALATDFSVLVASRAIGGAAAGGVAPVAMAFLTDRLPLEKRQVGISRLLAAGISGLMVGGVVGGVLTDLMGWRAIFVASGIGAAIATAAAIIGLRGASGPSAKLSLAAVLNNYRQVLANPLTKVCYGAVLLEGIAIFGIFPYVALLLFSAGETRASIAGLVISGFAIGGIVYAVFSGRLLPHFSPRRLMMAGAAMVAAALLIVATLPTWPVQFAAFFVVGFGFYLLHSSIMMKMSELAPNARGTAVAGHASAFFIGQGLGPAVYGAGLAAIGASATIAAAAVMMLAIGIATALLLHPRSPP